MSAEIIAIVISAAGVVVTLGASMFTGFAWILRRIDERVDGLDDKLGGRINGLDDKLSSRIDAVEEKLSNRIDAVEEKLSARIDAVEDKLGTRIDDVEDKLSTRIDVLTGEVTGVKIAIARLEGPPRHLVTASH